MRSLLRNFILLSSFIGIFMSCAEEHVNPVKEELMAEISFSMSVSDITKSGDDPVDEEVQMPCPDLNEINAESYQAVMVINLFGNPNDTAVVIRPIRIVDGKVTTEPFSIIMPDESQSSHELARMTLTTKNNRNEIYFSSLTGESKFKNMVPAEHWLPMELPIENFTKKSFGITLLCAIDHTPEDFGYGQWEVDLIKILCFGYKVTGDDICNPTGTAGPMETTVNIFKYNALSNETTLISTSASGKDIKGSLCFSDQSSVKDEYESFLVRIYFPETNMILSANLTLAQIYDYQNSGYWDPAGDKGEGYIHLVLSGLESELRNMEYALDPPYGGNDPWNFVVDFPPVCDEMIQCDCENINWEFPDKSGPGTPGVCDWIIDNQIRVLPGENLVKYLHAQDEGSSVLTPSYFFHPRDKLYIRLRVWGTDESKFEDFVTLTALAVDYKGQIIPAGEIIETRSKDEKFRDIETFFTISQEGCQRILMEVLKEIPKRRDIFIEEIKVIPVE